MSENLHELCCSLVEEFYGELHANLFSHLAYHGRLSVQAIAQKSHLPIKQVKCGLAVLVQSRLVYHHTTSEGLSTYQTNSSSTYNLIRFGRLLDLVQDQVGKYGVLVISEALMLGFTSISELEAKTRETLSKDKSNPTNGDFGNEQLDVEELGNVQTAIEALIRLRYLINIRSAHFQAPFDIRQDAEHHLKNCGLLPSLKGKKGMLEIEQKVEGQVRDWTTTGKPDYGYVPSIASEKKRFLDDNGDGNPSKRQRADNGGSIKVNGHTDTRSVFIASSDATVVHVSFNNLITDTRNNYLSSRAKKSLGVTSSHVLRAALLQIPSTEQWLSISEECWIDLGQLQELINDPRDHKTRNRHNGYHQNGNTQGNGIHTNEEDESGEDHMSYREVDRNLALLADGEFDFIQGAYGTDWKINKNALDQFVRQREILRLMSDRLGTPALRIVRMLIDKGKLDEKTLQELGLLGAKDLRQTLAQLKQMGYVDLQEVPRESQRLPMRTIFLWFYDPERVQKVLLDALYKSMARLMQRLRVQRRKLSSTLEKLERSDVRGNEEQIMSAAELRVLRRWQRMEQWILGELTRLDESVLLLRDL